MFTNFIKRQTALERWVGPGNPCWQAVCKGVAWRLPGVFVLGSGGAGGSAGLLNFFLPRRGGLQSCRSTECGAEGVRMQTLYLRRARWVG